MSQRIRSIVLLAMTAGAMTACKKKEVAPPPGPAVPPQQPTITPVTNPVTPPTNTAPTTDPGAEARARAAAIEAAKNTLTATIYFDYDKSDLRSDAQATLDSKIPLLQANPSVRLRIVGHTDERGSDEYNQALGQKRAAQALRYLEARGVASSRIDAVSMGESQPAMMGEGEASWSKNRRDEFQIVAGADQIRPAGRQ